MSETTGDTIGDATADDDLHTYFPELLPLGYIVLEWRNAEDDDGDGVVIWGDGDTPADALARARRELDDEPCPHCGQHAASSTWEIVRCTRDVVDYRLSGEDFDHLIWDWDLGAYRYAHGAHCIACHSDPDAEGKCKVCNDGDDVTNDVLRQCNLDPGWEGRALLRYVANMAGEEPIV